MNKSFDFCFDLAHLFRNSCIENNNYFSELENVLKSGSNSIKLVHFCDADTEEDNLGFGSGLMDIDKSFKILRKYYDGFVVVEVPVDEMKRCKDYLEKLMKF